MDLAAAPSINDARTQAHLHLIDGRLGALDLTTLLIYRIDSVPKAALKFLAWQFDVSDPRWQLEDVLAGESIAAITDRGLLTDIATFDSDGSVAGPSDYDTWRALLKIAIPLHRYRGTPYAVKTALATLGWNAVLLEGQDKWGGVTWPSDQGWAVFRVMIHLADGQAIEADAIDAVVGAIEFFKNARSWLDSVWFILPSVSDVAPSPRDRLTLSTSNSNYQIDAAPSPGDGALTLDIVAAPLADSYPIVEPVHDAHFRYSGITYGAVQPQIADSALTIGGQSVSRGG
jgi:P2-related tail formation protein